MPSERQGRCFYQMDSEPRLLITKKASSLAKACLIILQSLVIQLSFHSEKGTAFLASWTFQTFIQAAKLHK